MNGVLIFRVSVISKKDVQIEKKCIMNLLEDNQNSFHYNNSFRGYNNCITMMEVIYLLFTFKNIKTSVSLVNKIPFQMLKH